MAGSGPANGQPDGMFRHLISIITPILTRHQDPDIRELVPRIMDILSQRLEALYMSVAETSPHDPIIRKIAPLSRRARLLRG